MLSSRLAINSGLRNLGTVGSVQTGVCVQNPPGDVTTFATDAGKAPTRVLIFKQWIYSTTFPTTLGDQIRALNAIPVLTWEPWDPTAGATQPSYTLASIINGSHDNYITTWAQSAAAWGYPFYMRFAHEMNGNWYPWGLNINGNTSGQYAQAYNHVRDLCQAAGMTNAAWIWCPNVQTSLSSLATLYPGDAAVDLVGMDGYNFGTSVSGQTWQTWSSIYNSTISALTQTVAPGKRLIICEMGCSETGGNKASWISDMFQQLANNPVIGSFTWFNMNKEADFRIESSSAAQAAWAAGVADSRYA